MRIEGNGTLLARLWRPSESEWFTQATQAHRSAAKSRFRASEADSVIDRYNQLRESDKPGPPELPPVALAFTPRSRAVAARPETR
jgi:hypothetical protein